MLLISLCLQVHLGETLTWMWWGRWQTNTRRRCGGQCFQSEYKLRSALSINNTSTCHCLCARDETLGNRQWDTVTHVTLFPLSLSTVGCGLKQGHRWIWSRLLGSVDLAIPLWQPLMLARWSSLCSEAHSVKRASMNSSGNRRLEFVSGKQVTSPRLLAYSKLKVLFIKALLTVSLFYVVKLLMSLFIQGTFCWPWLHCYSGRRSFA